MIISEDLPGLRAAVGRLNRRFEAWAVGAGVSRGVRLDGDGVPAWPQGCTIPREVRALGAEILVKLGLPAAVEALLDPQASHAERTAVLRFLKDLSIGDAKSVARDGDGEDAPGVVVLPALDGRPVPPPDVSFEDERDGGELGGGDDSGEVDLETGEDDGRARSAERATRSIAAKLARRQRRGE